MKYLSQLFIIIFISFIGEILNYLIPLPIPASIYGLVIMLFVLKFGIIKLNQVKETSEFLISIMTLMFIPVSVGIVQSWDIIKEILIPLAIITFVTTVITMVISGLVTQFIIRLEGRRGK